MKRLKSDEKGIVMLEVVIGIAIASILLVYLFKVYNNHLVIMHGYIEAGIKNYKEHLEYLGGRI